MAQTQKNMPADADARVVALLLAVSENALDENQAAQLYNAVAQAILQVPAAYQIAVALQVVQQSGLPLTGEPAERFVTAVLYCVCYENDDGTPGYTSITLSRIYEYHRAFAPFFENAEAMLNALIDALRGDAEPS